SWGWTFVLWGVAYYVATAWSSGLVPTPLWSRQYLAWPVTMIAAAVITGITASRMGHDHPPTTLGRALGSIWSVMGISLFVVLFALGLSGHYDIHVYMAIIGGMLGVANGASGLILKWKMQLACAIVWLGAGVVGCFGSDNQAGIAFLAATFFCQIVFGIYVMVSEARRRRQPGAVHA
ncbi:MAG: hypothetical protein WBX18_14750, partial [Terracidiphilus sp.]